MTLGLLIVVFLGGAALLATARQHSWAAPGPLLGAYWFLALALPQIFARNMNISAYAVFALAAAAISFIVGSTLTAPPPRTPRTRETGRHTSRVGVLLLIGGSASAIAAASIRLQQIGLPLSAVFSLDGLLRTGNTLSIARYGGEALGTQLTAALLALTYAAALASSFVIRTRNFRGRALKFAPLGATIFYVAVTTERLALLSVVALYFGSALYASLLAHGVAPKIRLRTIVVAGLIVSGLATLFVGAALVRVGSLGPASIAAVESKLSLYAFGYAGGFSAWMDTPQSTENGPLWGTASLAGVEFLTGESRTATRGYDEFVPIDDFGSATNIFTYLRGLILDFTLPGALIVMFCCGLFWQAAYRKTLIDRSAIAASIGAGATAVLLLSMTNSMLSFTNFLAGLLIAIWVISHDFKSAIRSAHTRTNSKQASSTSVTELTQPATQRTKEVPRRHYGSQRQLPASREAHPYALTNLVRPSSRPK